MNLRRGFKRIAFVLSGIAGIICAGMSVVLVLSVRDDAQSYLRWEKENYIETYHYGITPEQARAELEKRKRIKELEDELRKQGVEIPSSEPKLIDLGPLTPEEIYSQELKEKQRQEAEKELRKLKNGFWVNLSKGSLVGICTLVGLVGGIIGFVIVWLICNLLGWLVLGFCDDNRLQPKRT